MVGDGIADSSVMPNSGFSLRSFNALSRHFSVYHVDTSIIKWAFAFPMCGLAIFHKYLIIKDIARHNVWPHFKSKSPYTFVLQGFTSKASGKCVLTQYAQHKYPRRLPCPL